MLKKALLPAIVLCCIPFTATAAVVISEVMWSGSDLSSADEWLELTNTGTGTVSLSGYTLTRLSDGREKPMLTLSEGTTIGSGETLLIANYNEGKSRLSVEADIVDASVSLSNTKLLLRLYDASGSLIDVVDDGVGVPFAGSNDGMKASMERIDLTGSGQLKLNWRTATTFLNFDDGAPLFGTPGERNGLGPSIDIFPPIEATNFAAESKAVAESHDSPLRVSWTPSTSLDLASQTLIYNGTGITLASSATGITLQNVGTGVTLRLQSTDTAGNTSSGITTVSRLFPNVKITEVLANPIGKDDEEWVEIGNLGKEAVDVGSWILDEGNSSNDYSIPSPTLLKPNQYIAFPKSVTDLPLGNKGEAVSLTRGLTVMDSWEYPETAEEVSFGRDPANPDVFRPFCIPTRNAPNADIPSKPIIVMQSGTLEGADRVSINLKTELPQGSLAHASCNWNYDDGFTSESCNPPSHTFTSPGTYIISFTFTNMCGESIRQNLSVNVSDSHANEEQNASQDGGAGSGSRSTGGGSEGGGRTSCTPSTFEGIRLSEFIPNPTGSDTDREWIELENTNEREVSLCGWELDDEEKGSKAFPLDTFTMPAHSYLLFPRNLTKIALNNANEHVRLFAPGKVLQDDISYETSTEGESFALRSDNIFVWTPFLTPGEENQFRTAERRFADDTVIVSAALPNPDGKDSGKEWIELTNVSEEAVHLTGWQIDNRSDTRTPYVLQDFVLAPHEVHRFEEETTGIQLTNAFDQARLLDPDGNLVSLLSWHDAVSGRVYRPETPGEEVSVYVANVIDGDTIAVEFEGKTEKVRLIGVDTPETVHPLKPVQYYGKEASNFTKSMLEGKTVTLRFGDERRDKYDRLLAYVILEDGTNFNGELIRRGYAYAYLRFPFALSDLFAEYEREARQAKLGLWADEEASVFVQSEKQRIEEETTEEEQPSESANPEETEEEKEYILEVHFSEVMSNPPKEGVLRELGEYLELFNPSDHDVSLEGWILDDDPNGSSSPKTLSKEFVMPAQRYALLCSGTGCDLPLGITLNNNGEDLSLTSPDGLIEETMTYPEMKHGKAYALANEWCVTEVPTPKRENICTRPESVEESENTITTNSINSSTTDTTPAKSTIIKSSVTLSPIDFLRKIYRPILTEGEKSQEEKTLPSLLAAIVPQIVHASQPVPVENIGERESLQIQIEIGIVITVFISSLLGIAFTRRKIV